MEFDDFTAYMSIYTYYIYLPISMENIQINKFSRMFSPNMYTSIVLLIKRVRRTYAFLNVSLHKRTQGILRLIRVVGVQY